MSTAIDWPEGAGDARVMYQEHDIQLLTSQTTNDYQYDWRSDN
jgi:hypothetical protein